MNDAWCLALLLVRTQDGKAIKPVAPWTKEETQHFLWLLGNYYDQIDEIPGAKNTNSKGFTVHLPTPENKIFVIKPQMDKPQIIKSKSKLTKIDALKKIETWLPNPISPISCPYTDFKKRLVIKPLDQYDMKKIKAGEIMNGKFNNLFLAPLEQFLLTHGM